jgi:hypothetical protein
VDIRFPTAPLPQDAVDRLPPPPPPRGPRPLAWLRRGMAWLEAQRWFLPGASAIFLVATVEILSSNLPLPLGMLSILGVALLVAFLVAVMYAYIRALQPKEVARPRSLLLIGTIVLIVLLLTHYGLVVIHALAQSFPHVPYSAMRAALPIPLGGVLLTVLFNSRLAFAGTLSLTILTGVMLAAPLSYFLFTFVGSVVGIFAIAGRQERTAFFRAGGAIGLGEKCVLSGASSTASPWPSWRRDSSRSWSTRSGAPRSSRSWSCPT